MQQHLLVSTFQVATGDYQTAGDASATIKRKLKQLGVDSNILRRIAVACYEAELNLIIHSMGGTITLEMSPSEITLTSADVGPGIADINQALKEGYSTASEEARTLGFGAGMGLPNMRRNADVFDIHSQLGKGTCIRMGFVLSKA